MTEPRPSTDPRSLPPIDAATGLANVYVECARGSVVKDKFDLASGALRLHKRMPERSPWPFAYGFICGTRAPDGDPLDAVVLSTRRVQPGSVIACRVLGAIGAEQTVEGETHANDRVIVADPACPGYGTARSIGGLDADVLDDIERFFIEYNRAQGRRFRVLGRVGAMEASGRIHGSVP